ncbi:unnamed protein product [Musa acuminata var. zebrina]
MLSKCLSLEPHACPVAFMDTVFLLRPEARSRFLRTAARALGCTYICLWSPLYHPSSDCFTSMDGWHHEDDSSGRPSSSSGSRSRRLFAAYLRSLCSIRCSCVPGWAFKSSLPYIELKDSDLMNSASMQVQRQFYQEAGIKTAAFLGCTSGEIEFGMTTSSDANMHANVEKVFSEDFIRQSQLEQEFIHQTQLEELFPPPDSSDSSSLRSFSVESPECSSLLLANTSTVAPHQIPMSVYDRHRTVLFPSTAVDDAAIARAMLAVISSNSSSAADRSWSGRRVGAFKAYATPAFAPRCDPTPSSHGQKMIKMLINLLKKMNDMRFEARTQDARPTSNQLHHMISERKRREKLNESFDALRMLLPPVSKKDKASVLYNTRNYLNALKAQISELERRNRLLEMQVRRPDEKEEDGDSNERVRVQISRQATESTPEGEGVNLVIAVRAGCNMIDLIHDVLQCLKRMGVATLLSVEAITGSPQKNDLIKASFTVRVKGADCDEETLEEAVTQAVAAVLERSATPTS